MQLTGQQLNRMKCVVSVNTDDVTTIYNEFMRLVCVNDNDAKQLYDELFVEHDY